MAETKEGEFNIENETSLIDVIQCVDKWKYMPKDRIVKWTQILAKEDLDYLTDLMGLSTTVLQQQRKEFGTKLYGCLHEIRSGISQIRLQIIESPLSGSIPVKAITGYYIDTGFEMNGHKAYIKVHDGAPEDERWVLYVMSSSGQYAVQRVNAARKNHCWLRSNEMAATHRICADTTWMYYRSDAKRMEPVQISIKALHR